MVALNFNAFGHDFEHGLMILRDSLTAALGALDAQRAKVSADCDAYVEGLSRGEPPVGDFNEETGSWDWEQSQFFNYELELIEETKSTIRKTHVIALYHLWERVVRHWVGAHSHEAHDELAARIADKGLQVHERMKAISDLNNALKHNSQRCGPRLLAEWPDVFPKNYAEMIERQKESAAVWREKDDDEFRPNWFDAVTLSDAHIDAIFEAVRASGPRSNMPF